MIIGLCGKKYSGKDTVADFAALKHDYVKRSFADPLKEAVKALFILTNDQLYGNQKEIPINDWYGCTPRKMLQFVGTDLLRDQLETIMPGIGKNVFVNNMRLYLSSIGAGNKIIISDVRFKNELSLVKEMKGVTIWIDRPSVQSNDTHASENDITKEDCDYCIDNDKDLSNLYNNITELFETI